MKNFFDALGFVILFGIGSILFTNFIILPFCDVHKPYTEEFHYVKYDVVPMNSGHLSHVFYTVTSMDEGTEITPLVIMDDEQIRFIKSDVDRIVINYDKHGSQIVATVFMAG